jgi:hypothetical protein
VGAFNRVTDGTLLNLRHVRTAEAPRGPSDGAVQRRGAPGFIAGQLGHRLIDNSLMPVHIPSGLTDDNDFASLMGTILAGILEAEPVDQVWIIQIDNWFDHKWLRFSGNGLSASWMFAGAPGAISFGSLGERFDSVKSPFSHSKVTFPPFSPGRILGQWSFMKSGDEYVEFPFPSMPHKLEKNRSATNLQRRVEHFSKSACHVWYSGNTIKNDRGSLMVYTVVDDRIVAWYAAFQRGESWSLSKTKGISNEKVLRLMAIENRGESRD